MTVDGSILIGCTYEAIQSVLMYKVAAAFTSSLVDERVKYPLESTC